MESSTLCHVRDAAGRDGLSSVARPGRSRLIFRRAVTAFAGLVLAAACRPPGAAGTEPEASEPLLVRVRIPSPRAPAVDAVFPALRIDVPGYVRVENARHLRVGPRAGVSVNALVYKRPADWRAALDEDLEARGPSQPLGGWTVWTERSQARGLRFVTVTAYRPREILMASGRFPAGDRRSEARVIETIRCVLLSYQPE